jgi:hypothetical protein
MGLLADPMIRFRNDLAESVSVRALLGIDPSGDVEADALEALKKIHIDGLPAPTLGTDAITGEDLQAMRPYILLYPSESDTLKIRVRSESGCIESSGEINLMISLPYSESKNDEGPTQVWLSTVQQVDQLLRTGDLLEPGILDYLGQASRLQVYEIDVVMFGRTPEADRLEYGDAYDVLLVCRWGVN